MLIINVLEYFLLIMITSLKTVAECSNSERRAILKSFQTDAIMNSNLIAQYQKFIGVSSCLAQCNLHPNCDSFFYNNLHGGCRLHDVRFTSLSNGIIDVGWTYYHTEISLSSLNSTILTSSSGKRYSLMFSPFSLKTWYQARDICHATGAKLAEPPTKSELQSVASKIPFYYIGAIWIGGTDDGSDGTYKWASSGDVIPYNNWPILYIKLGPLFNCLTITAVLGIWTEAICDGTSPFVLCEFT